MTNLTDRIAAFPRATLLSGPTPTEPLYRLSEHLDIELFIKRDDLCGLGFGGNKFRQLEFYLGAALAKNADTILITGAVQSNYARSAAAAAAKFGLKAIVQKEDRVAGMGAVYANSGNVLLGRMLGAEYMRYTNGEDEAGADAALRDRAAQLRAEGRTPYVIPLGLDNPPLGALGYVAAAREVLDQAPDMDAIVVASGSGHTHGGLIFGLRALGEQAQVHGICARRDAARQAPRLATITANIAALLGGENPVDLADILTWDSALAPGYGQLGESTQAAMALMARTEGLFLDPVYTGKAFAGLLDLLQDGTIRPGMRVLFVHTGGLAALFAYGDEDLAD